MSIKSEIAHVVHHY